MTEDPQYNPAWPLYMPMDFGWWNNFIGWVQPSGNGDRVIMLYVDYQEMRTNEENAKLALATHQARGYGNSPAAGATLLSPRLCGPIPRCSGLKSR
jgi:hypothetical protein